MQFTKIPLEPYNRMLRVGFGKHTGLWFIRVDLWWCGYRLKFLPRKRVNNFWT